MQQWVSRTEKSPSTKDVCSGEVPKSLIQREFWGTTESFPSKGVGPVYPRTSQSLAMSQGWRGRKRNGRDMTFHTGPVPRCDPHRTFSREASQEPNEQKWEEGAECQ